MNSKYKYLNKRFTNNAGHSGYVVKYNNSTSVIFKFDKTGYVGEFSMALIKKGVFKDKLEPVICGVGYIGSGEYKSSSKAYVKWSAMIARCYDKETQSRHPSYIGCSVHKDWHNFQNFAKWYDDNYPKDGKDYQLDKDKLVSGNRVYSAETCCFLTQEENSRISSEKEYDIITPTGKRITIKNLYLYCKARNLNYVAMCSMLSGNFKHHRNWRKP